MEIPLFLPLIPLLFFGLLRVNESKTSGMIELERNSSPPCFSLFFWENLRLLGRIERFFACRDKTSLFSPLFLANQNVL
jgi:hypothetical protein